MIWTSRMKSHLISNRLLNIREELTEIREFKEPQMQLVSSCLRLVSGCFPMDSICLQFKGFCRPCHSTRVASHWKEQGHQFGCSFWSTSHAFHRPKVRHNSQIRTERDVLIKENTFWRLLLLPMGCQKTQHNEMSHIFRRLFYKVKLL